jgi:hypothetical protein
MWNVCTQMNAGVQEGVLLTNEKMEEGCLHGLLEGRKTIVLRCDANIMTLFYTLHRERL